jgi:general secretion pathway protein B
MSDILDALRKAELQREHARGPGLSTQQHYAVAPSTQRARWLWGAAAAFVLGVSSAWLLAAYAGRGGMMETAATPNKDGVPDNGIIARPALRPPGPRQAAAPAIVAPAAADGGEEAAADPAQEVVTRPVPAAAPAVAPTVPVTTAVVPVAPAPEPPMLPVSTAPPPSPEAVAVDAPARQELAMIRDPFTPPPRQAPQHSLRFTPAPVAEAPPAEDPVPLLRTLPYRFQSMVPKLVINAQAYAHASEERFVIINMKKYGEGEQTVEGVRIEAIREQDIVLDYQGQQFRLQR